MKNEKGRSRAAMTRILADLSETGCVWGVKAEFEAEGTRFLELLDLNQIARESNLKLAVKIGGCEAVRDLDELRKLGVDAIIAPMVESAYAVHKFNSAVARVYGGEQRLPEFFVNFETASAWNQRGEILRELERADLVSGIVFGRVDFTLSSGLTRDDINSNKVLDCAREIASMARAASRKFIIGGGVSPLSFDFLDKIFQEHLTRFETRKIVFHADSSLSSSDRESLILLAVQFELEWLRFKQSEASRVMEEDLERIQMLTSRWFPST